MNDKNGKEDTVNVALMKAMGSKSGASNPMPVAQHQAFLDVSQSEDNRVLAAIWDRTIDPADDWTRSEFAREKDGRPTQNIHLVAATGIKASNLSAALDRLENAGKIRRSEGKIFLRADVPAPNLVSLRAKKDATKVICSDNLNAQELQFLAHLEDTDQDRFRAVMARLVATEVWGAQVLADAQAWGRERIGEIRQQVFTESGYTNGETGGRKRGRKRKRPATTSDAFKVAVSFPQLSVQKKEEFDRIASQLSVQNGKVILNKNKKNSDQKPHPYGLEFESSESQLASTEKVDAKPKTSEAGLKLEQKKRAIKNEINERLRMAKLTALGAVQIDNGTLNNMANDLARLDTAAAVMEVLDVLEHRAREIKAGKHPDVKGWGYLVNTVRREVDKLLRKSDLKEQVKSAAAGKRF
jgi:DNA-binding MarR family transcriptional regulator